MYEFCTYMTDTLSEGPTTGRRMSLPSFFRIRFTCSCSFLASGLRCCCRYSVANLSWHSASRTCVYIMFSIMFCWILFVGAEKEGVYIHMGVCIYLFINSDAESHGVCIYSNLSFRCVYTFEFSHGVCIYLNLSFRCVYISEFIIARSVSHLLCVNNRHALPQTRSKHDSWEHAKI